MSENRPKILVIKSLESILVIGYILFEELIWNVFAKPIYLFFKQLTLLDSLKQTFLEMNRYLLLSVFIFILIITEGLGFIAGFYFVSAQIYIGVMVYTLKIPVAAFTFWLFELTKDQLMTFQWLKTAYQYLMSLIEKFKASSIHVYLKQRITSLRLKMKSLIQQSFGKGGFFSTIKSHYLVFKPLVTDFFKPGKTN